MGQPKKLSLLSEYERFVLTSLYRQAAEENGHPPDAPERKRIRDEYIASLGKDIPQTRPYRKHKKPGSDDRTFHWQLCGPMWPHADNPQGRKVIILAVSDRGSVKQFK
ncbi:hypothetical protein KG522_004096 [Salmonella enterica subsp. diarizonae serovar 50:z52:z35]|nr:hypothetical protein [Salmonella enterica subsp. enterica serovar Hato]EDR8621761.1 DUF3811 domain-containing protein [Salmonella enterica]EHN1754986.1 hypothetical protein [Salmonella enterica subsp. diarizonae serovar 50:z52:z35]HAK7957560.1 DUF3811 domain-containing protein [Salmonella enterica]HAK8071637.1 DUF3811 domain-containing protein [Salmonella enterica]